MLNVFGPANNLGVGIHCVKFCEALERAGEEITMIPPFGGTAISSESIKRWVKNREAFDPKNPSLMIFDSQFLTQFCGEPRIGFCVTETDVLDPVQLAAIKSCDIVLTPSEWGRRVLAMHGVIAHVVNEGYDPDEFKYIPSWDFLERTPIKFCHVGKFEERKGTMLVLRCFFEALIDRDAVLEIHCDNPFMPDWVNRVHDWVMSMGFRYIGTGYSGGNPLYGTWRRVGLSIVVRPPQGEHLAAVYAGSDCGIFPSKGEGWGLPILECIATGTPVIVGNWTGQSEYIGDGYPRELTLERSHQEPANDGVWFHGTRGNWNVPDRGELVEKIRWAYENIRAFRAAESWAREVARIRQFSWDAAAAQFNKLLYK